MFIDYKEISYLSIFFFNVKYRIIIEIIKYILISVRGEGEGGRRREGIVYFENVKSVYRVF